MDPKDDDVSWRQFVTNVGLVTSRGPLGDNIMSAEWTHNVSYEPMLLMVNLRESRATAENIRASKEFGVNLAGEAQNVFSSVAGNNKGREVDKIAVLRELGAEFYEAKKINCLMLKGAAANFECKLVNTVEMGDHVAFVGEAVESDAGPGRPITYHGGKYYKIGDNIAKPGPEFLEKIAALLAKHARK
jgi:flavin reductase (DIM6/NTAB) family NADH-FMN oxidoreductase RutF